MAKLRTFRRGPFCITCGGQIRDASLCEILSAFVRAPRPGFRLGVTCPSCPPVTIVRILGRSLEDA